ncbi:MAG: FtsH protease activity modulator HflK [Thermoanaerobaculia bacterium]
MTRTMRRALAVAAGLAAAVWLLAGISALRPAQQGVVLRLGAVQPLPLGPGIHWRPAGIDRVVKVEVTRTETVPIGFRTADGGRAMPLPSDEGQWLTGDTNILAVQLAVQYRVARPVEWVVNGRDTAEVVRRAAESVVTGAMGVLPVDDALTGGRHTLLEEVRRGTQELLDRWKSGVAIVSVALRSVDPPPPVLAAFQDVQDAKSDRERFVNEAESYANDTLPRARGEAEALVSAAASQRQRRVEEAHGDAARFDALRREASLAPGPLRARLYLETLERVLPRMRLYVVDEATRLRLVKPETPAAVAVPGS